jgi:hypothetical protein
MRLLALATSLIIAIMPAASQTSVQKPALIRRASKACSTSACNSVRKRRRSTLLHGRPDPRMHPVLQFSRPCKISLASDSKPPKGLLKCS